MTEKQRALYLMKRLYPKELSEVIAFMSKILADRQMDSKVADLSYSSKDLFERFVQKCDRLRKECAKYPVEDLETARHAVLSKKYPEYF